MRPRVFPAEDRGIHVRGRPAADASMRPRVFPAEDANMVAFRGHWDKGLQ